MADGQNEHSNHHEEDLILNELKQSTTNEDESDQYINTLLSFIESTSEKVDKPIQTDNTIPTREKVDKPIQTDITIPALANCNLCKKKKKTHTSTQTTSFVYKTLLRGFPIIEEKDSFKMDDDDMYFNDDTLIKIGDIYSCKNGRKSAYKCGTCNIMFRHIAKSKQHYLQHHYAFRQEAD